MIINILLLILNAVLVGVFITRNNPLILAMNILVVIAQSIVIYSATL